MVHIVKVNVNKFYGGNYAQPCHKNNDCIMIGGWLSHYDGTLSRTLADLTLSGECAPGPGFNVESPGMLANGLIV